jgi:hypothetical protein
MTEHEVFEARLRSAMGRYVADGPSDFDALEFARAVAAAEPRRRRGVALHWPRVVLPRLAWLLLATAMLIAALAAAALITGSQPTLRPLAWQRITLAGDGSVLDDVLPVEGGYLAVGEGGYVGPVYVWTSGDGLAWDEVPTGSTFVKAIVRALVRTDDGYVAAGMEMSGTGDRAAMWRSADGRHWHPVVSIAGAEHAAIIEDLASADGRFVALGRQLIDSAAGQPLIWASDDAEHWDGLFDAFSSGDSITELEAVDSGFVAIGPDDVWTSVDGDAWIRHPVPAPDSSMFWPATVAVGRDGRIVASRAGGQLYVSWDGTTWATPKLPASDTSTGPPEIVDLTATSWGFAAVSAMPEFVGEEVRYTSATLWISRDGVTWEARDLQMVPEFECLRCVELFAAGNTLIVWTSTEAWALPGAVSPDVIP